jgi:hypothetical protein
MQDLVKYGGGIDKVNLSRAYVLHADRVMATLNNKTPTYHLPADGSIHLAHQPKHLYGSAFVSSPSFVEVGMLTQRSLDYCWDVVRLVELFESTGMCFDPRKAIRQSKLYNIEYFYYSRDRLEAQFALLNSELHNHQSQEYCIVLAARIAEYPITWANYIPTLTMLLADR